MNYLQIRENDKILVIAPHPDDECIGLGGVLLKYKKNCRVIVITDGAIGQENIKKSETIEIRKKEFIDEMKYLGISDYYFLEVPDGTLLNNTDCLKGIDFTEYDYVFVTGAKDGHPDHTGAYEAVINSFMKIQKEECPRLFLYEVHKQLAEPSHCLDITELIDEKRKLIGYHKSQIKTLPYDDIAILNAGYRALQNRMPGKYLEVFQEIYNHGDSMGEEVKELERKFHKHVQFYQLLVRWMKGKNNGIHISKILSEHGIFRVVIYGFAELGELLYEELSDSEVSIAYILDKNPAKCTSYTGVEILAPISGMEKPDAVIVTAIYYFNEIKDELNRLGYQNIYSLREIIDWM